MIDSSAVLSLLFPDEHDRTAAQIGAHLEESRAVVPALFRWELRNALLTAARRGRVTYAWVLTCLNRVGHLPIDVDPVPLPSSREGEVELARRFGLSAYDAAYLDLAQRRSLPLMTRDERLGAAADELGLLWRPR